MTELDLHIELKKILLSNPSIEIDDVRAELAALGINVSYLLVKRLCDDFRQSLAMIQAAGVKQKPVVTDRRGRRRKRHECQSCGRTFIAGRSDKKFCSPKCKMAGWRAK